MSRDETVRPAASAEDTSLSLAAAIVAGSTAASAVTPITFALAASIARAVSGATAANWPSNA